MDALVAALFNTMILTWNSVSFVTNYSQTVFNVIRTHVLSVEAERC